jgi:hypothetical protein
MRDSQRHFGDLVEVTGTPVVWSCDDDGVTWVLSISDGALAVIIDPNQEEFAEIFVASACEIAYCGHEFLCGVA